MTACGELVNIILYRFVWYEYGMFEDNKIELEKQPEK